MKEAMLDLASMLGMRAIPYGSHDHSKPYLLHYTKDMGQHYESDLIEIPDQ